MNEFSLCSLTSYDIRTRSEDDLDRKLELRAKKDRAAFFVLREAMMQTFTQWSKYVPKIRSTMVTPLKIGIMVLLLARFAHPK